MSKEKVSTGNPLIWDLILVIACLILIGLGISETLSAKLQEGIINIVIGVAILVIPGSRASLNYKKGSKLEKGILVLVFIGILVSTGYLLYLGFKK